MNEVLDSIERLIPWIITAVVVIYGTKKAREGSGGAGYDMLLRKFAELQKEYDVLKELYNKALLDIEDLRFQVRALSRQTVRYYPGGGERDIIEEADFRRWFIDHFTRDEMRIIAQDLGLIGSVDDKATKESLAMQMIEAAGNRNIFGKLKDEAYKQRGQQ